MGVLCYSIFIILSFLRFHLHYKQDLLDNVCSPSKLCLATVGDDRSRK